jgi:hypothetical protein
MSAADGLGLTFLGIAEVVSLVPTVIVAVLAVLWFRSKSTSWGAKNRDEAEEGEKKDVRGSKGTATGGPMHRLSTRFRQRLVRQPELV